MPAESRPNFDLRDSPFGAILRSGHINVCHLLLAESLIAPAPERRSLFSSVTRHQSRITIFLGGFVMATITLSEKLDQLGARYDELTQELSSAEIVSDSSRFQKIAKQQSELGEIVAKHREFKQIEKDLAGAHQMIVEAEDAEMKQMAHEEEKELTARKETVERELKLLLLPKDPLATKSSIVKIPTATDAHQPGLF